MGEFTVNITKGIYDFDYYAQCNNCYENIREIKTITDMWMETHECSINKLSKKEHDEKLIKMIKIMFLDIWNVTPVLLNMDINDNRNVKCGYKWSECKCSRKYKTLYGFKRTHQNGKKEIKNNDN